MPHHDLELEDETGRRLAKARLPEGLEGITRLHALVAQHAPADWAELPSEEVAARVVVGIETDRGPWVTALRSAGYQVFAINPLSPTASPTACATPAATERSTPRPTKPEKPKRRGGDLELATSGDINLAVDSNFPTGRCKESVPARTAKAGLFGTR